MNAEFHRIARRDKKAFLSDQYKETEESNRIGKDQRVFPWTWNNRLVPNWERSMSRLYIVTVLI